MTFYFFNQPKNIDRLLNFEKVTIYGCLHYKKLKNNCKENTTKLNFLL